MSSCIRSNTFLGHMSTEIVFSHVYYSHLVSLMTVFLSFTVSSDGCVEHTHTIFFLHYFIVFPPFKRCNIDTPCESTTLLSVWSVAKWTIQQRRNWWKLNTPSQAIHWAFGGSDNFINACRIIKVLIATIEIDLTFSVLGVNLSHEVQTIHEITCGAGFTRWLNQLRKLGGSFGEAFKASAISFVHYISSMEIL